MRWLTAAQAVSISGTGLLAPLRQKLYALHYITMFLTWHRDGPLTTLTEVASHSTQQY